MKAYVRDTDYRQAIRQRFNDTVTLVEDKHEAHIIITGHFTAADAGKALKAVIIPYTGHDRIDLEALRIQGVALFNTTVHSRYVAEKAVQLMHALLGNVVNYHQNLAHGDWSNRMNDDRVRWASAFGKKVGIYGYGRIGQIIHDLIKPFSPEVYVLNRGKSYQDATALNTLHELIDQSDIVFIAAPKTATTEGAFNRDALARMQGKHLINVGRGPIVDEDALFWALKTGVLKGFASDVWYQYPQDDIPRYPSKHPLQAFPNVIMSPHCAAMTPNAPDEMRQAVLDHMDAIMKGDLSGALDLSKLVMEASS